MIGKFVALHRFTCQIFWLKEKHQFFFVFFLSTWLMIFTKKISHLPLPVALVGV